MDAAPGAVAGAALALAAYVNDLGVCAVPRFVEELGVE
jgi:hypothetical protein